MKAYQHIRGSAIQIIQDNPNEARIEYFYVDPDERGNNIGTRLMKSACKDADREGLVLYLEPVPFSALSEDTKEIFPPGLNFKQLCAFYRNFGFRFMPGSEIMKRIPRKS